MNETLRLALVTLLAVLAAFPSLERKATRASAPAPFEQWDDANVRQGGDGTETLIALMSDTWQWVWPELELACRNESPAKESASGALVQHPNDRDQIPCLDE